MQTDFDSIFSDCSEFKELLIIELEEENVILPKESVSRGTVRKKTRETKKLEVPTAKEVKDNETQQTKENKSEQTQKEKVKHVSNTQKNQNTESNEKKLEPQKQNDQKFLPIVKEVKYSKTEQTKEKKSEQAQIEKVKHVSNTQKNQNIESNEKKLEPQKQNDQKVLPIVKEVKDSKTEQTKEKKSEQAQKEKVKHISNTQKNQNTESNEKKLEPQKQNDQKILPIVKEVKDSKIEQIKEKKSEQAQIENQKHVSNTQKIQITESIQKKQEAQNPDDQNILPIAKEIREIRAQLKEENLQQSQKEPPVVHIPKIQNLLIDKKPSAQDRKEKNVSNTSKPKKLEPQKKEPSKSSPVKTENKNESNMNKNESNEKSVGKQANTIQKSFEKLLKARESNIRKRDKSLDKTIIRLKKLEEENIDKLEKSHEDITIQAIENETKILQNTVNMLLEISNDAIIDEDIKHIKEKNNAAKLRKSTENNKDVLKEVKHSKEKKENLKEFKKPKESTDTILKVFRKENIGKLEKTIENKLKDHIDPPEMRLPKPDLPKEDLEDDIPPVEVLQLQEREVLLSKIEDMEKLHAKLELHLSAQHSLPEGSNYDVNKIHNKFANLQRENKNLERRIVFLMQQNFERIDDLKDNLRYLTKQETDVVYTYKELKSKMPDIEKIQASNAKLINKIREVPVTAGVSMIQDLKIRLVPMINTKERLENTLLKLKRDQVELIDRLQHKKRMSVLEKAEIDTEIKKLQATCRFLEDIKRDLVKKFEVAKMKVRESSICEIEKIRKLELSVGELSERFRKLSHEKKELEKINTSLKDKVVRTSQELNSREIYVTSYNS